MTVRKMYMNIAEISKAAAEAGSYWFSKDTIKFFDGRVESRVYDDGRGGRLWVDSIQDHGRFGGPAPREYKIARFDTDTLEIDRVLEAGHSFRTKAEAEHYLTDNLI